MMRYNQFVLTLLEARTSDLSFLTLARPGNEHYFHVDYGIKLKSVAAHDSTR